MISLLFSCIFLLVVTSSVHTEKLEMKVFRCMGEIKENCTLFQANETYHLVPDDVLNIYMRQERKVQNVLDSGQLYLLSNHELCSMSPAMLMLIPTIHFTSIRAEYISAAIKCWEENLAIVRKLMKSISLSGDMDWFFITLQDYELPDSVLNIIAEYVVINNNSNLEVFIAKKFSILEHLVPSQILSPMSTKILAQLSSTKFSPWFLNSKAIRIWSFAMVFYEYPLPLNKWNDNLTRRMEKMLVGVTPDDLNFLNLTIMKNKFDLLKMNFSILQIRTLYNHFFEKEYPNKLECKSLEFLQVKLLPEQIQQCLNVTFDLRRIEMPKSINSIFSAKQIVLYHMKKVNCSESHLKEDNFLFINKFVFALPPDILDNTLKKSSLSLSSLIQLQSPLLTEMQTYYLTAKGSSLILNSPLIYNCYELLQVISAAQITEVPIPSNVYYHLLSHMPASNNLPRSVVLLNKIWTDLASETNFRELLHNRDAAKFVELLPSKYVRNFSENFIKSIYNLKTNYSSAIYNLPEDFLSILFEEARGTLFNKNYEISRYVFVGGLTCEHILTSNTAEFIVLISQYNHYLRDIGKDFPKNLQSCTVRKLYEYLEMKNQLLQQYISNNFLSHLTESEIEAVGGYVLTSLPIDNLVRSENIVDIIKAIGKCSLSELIIAASKEKLNNITTIFMEFSGIEEISLFTLGNLTVFLPEYFMEDINIRDFKLMLESGYLDRRVCANSNERRIIANLVKRTFGDIKTWTPHILVTLGDMLLVIADELQFIDDKVLMQAADLITLNYHQLIDWPKPNPFFKTCAHGLDSAESELYMQSLQKLVMWLLEGLSMQRDSIEIPKPEEHLYDKAIFQNGSILDVRIETRKVIDPRQDNVLEHNANTTDMTTNLLDDVPSQKDGTTTATESTEQNYTNEDDATYNYHIGSVYDDKTENITYSSLYFQDSNINSSIEKFKDISGSSLSSGIDSFVFTEATDVFSSPYDKENQKVFQHNDTDEKVSSTQNENEYTSATTGFTQDSTEDYTGDYQNMTEKEPPIKDIVDHPSFNDTSTFKTDTTYNNLYSLSVEHQSELDSLTSVTAETLSENLIVPTFFRTFHDNSTNSNSSYNVNFLTTTTETLIKPQENLNAITPTSIEFLNGGHNTFQGKINSIDTKVSEMSTVRNLQESEISNFHSKLISNNLSESQTSSVVLLNNITNTIVLEEITEPAIEATPELLFKHNVKKLFKIFSKSKPSVISFMESPTTTSSTEMYSFSEKNNTDSTNTQNLYADTIPNFSESTLKAVTPDTRVTLHEIKANQLLTNHLSNNSQESKISSTELLINAVNNSQNKVIEPTIESTTELFFKNKVKKLFNIFFKPKPRVISLPESLPITSTTEMNSFFEQDNNDPINIFNFFSDSSGDTTLISETTPQVDRPEDARVRNINSSLTSFNIKTDRRYVQRRNTSRKITCDQIRIIGNIVEIIVTEDFINMMSEKELNNCIDMFGQMDLTRKLQMLIWKRIHKRDHHFLGKLIGAAQVSDIQRLDLNLTKPWILETLHNLGMYGNKQIKLYVANEISENSVSLNFESVVSMGSIMCHLLPLSKFLSPEVFLQTSKILGKVLTCNPQCLDKMIKIAMNEKAFGPIEKWTEADVNTLGVIVAGLSTDELYEFFTNNFKALGKISIEAMECIMKHRQQALSFLKKDAIYSLPYSAALVLNQTSFTSLDELQKAVLSKYLSDPSYNDTSSHKSTSVRAEGCFLIINLFIVGFAALL